MSAKDVAVRAQTKSIHANFDKDPDVVQFDDLQAVKRPTTVPADIVKRDIEALNQNGYVIIPQAISQDKVQRVRKAVEPHLQLKGRNNFEGLKTQRVYALLSKSRELDELAIHPRVVATLDHFLLPNPLLTAYQAIKILPGETRQPFHTDDQFMNITRPHRPFSLATIWAIDEFTAENGGTLIIPKSHLWGDRLPSASDIANAKPVVMPPGSVVVFLSTLWHSGGNNVTPDQCRLAITAQYCEPWLRPQENQMLSLSPKQTLELPPQLRSMAGYSIHAPFVGHVNGLHPLKYIPGAPQAVVDSWGVLKRSAGSHGVTKIKSSL